MGLFYNKSKVFYVISLIQYMKLHKLSKNVYAITGLTHPIGVNVGFVINKREVIVIDASWTVSDAKKIIRTIKKITNKPIRWLINTEYHSDHVFGNIIFKEHNVKIISHENTTKVLKKLSNYPSKMKKISPNINFGDVKVILPDLTFKRKKHLNGVKMFYSPGHTNTNIVVFLPKERILFASDSLYPGRNPTVKFGNKKLWKEWLKSLEKMEILNPKLIVPGHGKIIGGDNIKKEFKRHKEFLMSLIKSTPY